MIKRRTFVATGAAMLAALGAAGIALSNRLNRQRLKDFLGRFVLPTAHLEREAPVGALSEAEMATMLALAEVLLPGGHAEEVQEFARLRVTGKAASVHGYLAQCQRAVQLLDETSTQQRGVTTPFAQRPGAEREEVLRSLLWRYRAESVVSRYLESLFLSERTLAFRRLVVADLLAAFYRSSHGWASIGYSHYPGVPAKDPLDYVRPVTW